MSFLKAQVSFPSNFPSIDSAIRHNSFVLFQLKHYIFVQKEPIKVQMLETFEMLESKFVKLLKSILKRQVNSSSNFASFFIVMTYSSFVNLKLEPFLLWIKGSYQSPNFVTFECSGESLPNALFQSTVSFCSNFASIFSDMKDNSSVLFLD